ncbi:MAG TPA: ATP-binding protein, partial [Vampirovibrionales bacterium]
MNFEELSHFSVKIRNFKCFGVEEQGFDSFKPINIILGRNNSGKSSLLEVIQLAVELESDLEELDISSTTNNWNLEQSGGQLIFQDKISSQLLNQVFPFKSASERFQSGIDYYLKWFVNKSLKWSLSNSKRKPITINGQYIESLDFWEGRENTQAKIQNITSGMRNTFTEKKYYKLSPNRDIIPEPNTSKINLEANGRGFTNLMQRCLNNATLNKRDLVERNLLEQLNSILVPDAQFSRILCQQLDNNNWEIYLEEEQKGRVALSQSGHGLKTVIIVLCYTILVPRVFDQALDQCIFAFEELENNLHPALLRRLLNYLEKVAIEEKCLFFLSTHSSIVIDLFSQSQNAQIVHVTHDGKQSKVKAVNTYVENKDLLFDLGIRASDLLQANCIIWVEGPSDRIYINRWIELWSEGELKEG